MAAPSPRSPSPALRPDAATATRAVQDRASGPPPTIALVLGSGLGGLGQCLERATRIPYDEIPGMPGPSIEGHEGALLTGEIHGRRVVALSGRPHWYQGHPEQAIAFPVRLVHALGARTLFVSNAAGAIRADLEPGTLMLIRDHINLMARNPLVGPAGPGEQRVADMSAPYDPELTERFRRAAVAAGLRVADGVYAGVLGPSYETPAEVRMLARIGADAVGMSSVPEVLVARALGMRVVAVSCVTNPAAGVTAHRPNHAEVVAVGRRISQRLEQAVREWAAGV